MKALDEIIKHNFSYNNYYYTNVIPKISLKLRYTEDRISSYYVFDNQIESALNIIDEFKRGNRWCLLMAEMQSGKSGTFFSVPYIISRNVELAKQLSLSYNYKDDINTFLLTPMNHKELITQFEQDIVSFTGVDIKRNVIHNTEMSKFLNINKSEWSITDIDMIEKMKKNSIILIDESHYGSNNNQILNRFLEEILEIKACGDNTCLKEKNIYVLSISATPMAENLSIDNKYTFKKIILLKNSDSYFGISEMFENNKVKQSFDFSDDIEVDSFIKHIDKIDKNGYILVRTSSKNASKIIQKLNKNITYCHYNHETTESLLNNTDINNILMKKPITKHIIFFKGKLRVGQRVKTNNVIMVHDTYRSKSDTTVQSFLGRCCGYNKNQDIDIFCDLESARGYYKWTKNGFSKLQTPKSRNVDIKILGIEPSDIYSSISEKSMYALH